MTKIYDTNLQGKKKLTARIEPLTIKAKSKQSSIEPRS